MDILDIVDDMPEYPNGGLHGLMQYLSQNIVYPPLAHKEGREGRVVLTFVVERDGSIVDIKIKEASYSDLNEEAIRVVEAMPKWKPGKHKGKTVRVKYTIPINFKLPE